MCVLHQKVGMFMSHLPKSEDNFGVISYLLFTWVLRIEFKFTALYNKVLYLSHLTAPPPRF